MYRKTHYDLFKEGVIHCTFDPEGPGVVRIHLIPPKYRFLSNAPYIVILNGYYLLPLGRSWAVLLANFMKEVCRFEGKPIGEEEEDEILARTLENTRRAYPSVTEEYLQEDLEDLLAVLFAVARGKDPHIDLEKLSLRAYAPHMTAPHRMDLMISAMTDAAGQWQCNQKCRFCYAAGQPLSGSRELSTKDWKTVIEKLAAARVPMVTFTGGEPTLRQDLPELVAHARRMVTRLNTNGIALTPDLCQRLRQAGLDSVQVTLYAHDPRIHNELVGCEGFEQTVAGIRNALAAGLDLSINTPLCRANADYRATLAFARSLGVRYATASGLICTGKGTDARGEELSADALCNALAEGKAYADTCGMELDFTSPGLIPKEKLEALGMNVPACGAALSNMAVAPDGRVIPCQSWLSADASLGDLLTVPFKKIWRHPQCISLRRMTEVQALTCPFRKEGNP